MSYKITITLKQGDTEKVETLYTEDPTETTGYGSMACWIEKFSGDTIVIPVHQIIKIREQVVE